MRILLFRPAACRLCQPSTPPLWVVRRRHRMCEHIPEYGNREEEKRHGEIAIDNLASVEGVPHRPMVILRTRNPDHDQRHRAGNEARQVKEHEVADVATLNKCLPTVLVTNGAFQSCAALLNGTGQKKEGGPDKDKLK
mmetsp:Transcript_88156/g.166126  ORF Transcript_88156/g.166126 Transcript_88156/m.166126 type:complete len:138 (-) Transcript_88156:365-778(-)